MPFIFFVFHVLFAGFCSAVFVVTPDERARELLSMMTLDEKISLLHGTNGPYVGNIQAVPRLNISALYMGDGPQGFRDEDHPGTTTQWPSALAVSASWDAALTGLWGEAMGQEFHGKGASIQLGPGVNVARVPVNGRNFEYLSGEDPYLGATLVGPLIKGIQSNGVMANVKHYIQNNQESDRMTVSANIDERTHMEIYVPPFQAAVDAGVLSVMCSYNKINGMYACENDKTLNKELRGFMGYKYWVMSDWGATHSTELAANSGLDQEMPSDEFFGANLKNAVLAGQVKTTEIDAKVYRILLAMFTIGMFDKPRTGDVAANVTSEAHNKLCRKIAAESTVLLKNKGSLLPLSPNKLKKIAVFGVAADADVLTGGSGSGMVLPYYDISPLSGIIKQVDPKRPARSTQCNFDPGFDYYQSGSPQVSATSPQHCCERCAAHYSCNAWTFDQNAKKCWLKPDNKGRVANPAVVSGTCAPTPAAVDVNVTYYYGTDLQYAATLAKESDLTVMLMATTSSEGGDRPNLSLKEEDVIMAQTVGRAQSNSVAVIIAPGAVLTSSFDDFFASVIVMFLPGQEEGNALADVLFGAVNPSGKLPITFPNVENEVQFTPEMYPGVNLQANYSEKLAVGYRWYSLNNKQPRYPFGFGLSYTTFGLSDIQVIDSKNAFDVVGSIANTGPVSGSQVVQLYIEYPAGSGEPPIQLKNFTKVFLLPKQSQSFSFRLNDRDLSIWDVNASKFVQVSGIFTVYVGFSSADLAHKASFSNNL